MYIYVHTLIFRRKGQTYTRARVRQDGGLEEEEEEKSDTYGETGFIFIWFHFTSFLDM